jgi:hypothetical protein
LIVPYKPYVPRNVGEVLDKLAFMMLAAPTFKDKTGYFPERNIYTVFLSLNEGLLVICEQLGEECCAMLRAMSEKMWVLFESDPDDNTGDANAGRKIVREMEDILRSVTKRSRPKWQLGANQVSTPGDLAEKRRKLISAQASYCGTPKAAKIIPLRKQALP